MRLIFNISSSITIYSPIGPGFQAIRKIAMRSFKGNITFEYLIPSGHEENTSFFFTDPLRFRRPLV
jgi:flagellar assembly factor FliW